MGKRTPKGAYTCVRTSRYLNTDKVQDNPGNQRLVAKYLDRVILVSSPRIPLS